MFGKAVINIVIYLLNWFRCMLWDGWLLLNYTYDY